MTRWKIATAVALASLMLAGPAFAQATTGAQATGTETKGEKAKGTAEERKAEKPKATGATDAAKSDTMKSDTMKADKSTAKRDRKGGMAMAGDEKVKAAQQALKDKGHDPGEIDGKMGPKTQAALRDFQKAQGMTATGRLDAKTMQALGVEGKTSAAGETPTSGSASPSTAAPSTGGAASPPGAQDASQDKPAQAPRGEKSEQKQ